MKYVIERNISIELACKAFNISQTCYRYKAKLSSENEEIADWLVRLTHNQKNWGFGLCYLYLRNVKKYPWNHKRVYRIYRVLELNLRIKPKKRLVRALNQIIEWRGKQKSIRCDNGPEYISAILARWAERHKIKITYIQPGKPQQNAYVERYNRTVRYDWLGQNIFDSIDEVQEFATKWLWHYNNERPNMALGGITPRMKLDEAA